MNPKAIKDILIAEDMDGGTRYFDISTPELQANAALYLIEYRLNDNVYDYEEKETLTEINRIIDEKDGNAAWTFLQLRSEEYGEFEFLEIKTLLAF